MSTETTSSRVAPAVAGSGLTKIFSIRQGFGRKAALRAVNDVSFSIERGQTLGVVGESGCGKTTTGRMILGLEQPTAGKVLVHGEPIEGRRALKALRRTVQAVFQSPAAALSPRMRVEEIITEPLIAQGMYSRRERRAKAAELLESVGLASSATTRFPHEFSGGQQQRIAIARALSIQPSVIVLDEPVSALDVSIRAQIVNLLMDLQSKTGVSFLLIAHDIALVQHMSEEIAVMYLGEIVERGPAAAVVTESLHPYTKALIEAVPIPDPRTANVTIELEGEPPNPIDPPLGCTFHPRCPSVMDVCIDTKPEFKEIAPRHYTACHLHT